jgi:hypothetical protein
MRRILLFVYMPLITVYLLMSLLYPTDPATIHKYHLDLTAARAVSLGVAIPFIAIWLIAFYGSYALKEYSLRIKRHRDGAAFVMLATGVQITALYLPIRAVTKAVLNYTAHLHPVLAPYTTTVITYVNLLFPLVGFICINRAAKQLTDMAKARASLRALHLLGLTFIGLGVLYCYVIFTSKGDIAPTNWLITTQQYIPTFLRITTVMIPNLYMWLVGLIAVYEIYLYQKYAQGVLYRQALRLLSIGLAAVIASSILLQFITALSPHLTKLSLRNTLVITYSMLFLLGAAYITIARGVQQFKKLDEL